MADVDVREDFHAVFEQLTVEQQEALFGSVLELAGHETPGTAADTERLMTYWAEGEGAAKIRWGEPHDFYRCEAELGKYVGPSVVKGLCSNLHKRALGVRPGQESAEETPMGHVELTETIPLSEAGTLTPGGRMRVRAISAGKGSSGYYSPEVLEDAGRRRLVDAGTHLYFDHPSKSERRDRPERSVRDIAAVFTSPATYNPDTQALEGEIQVFTPYRNWITEMAPHIGLSISGSATDIKNGVIEGLHAIDSVDLVTKAGRGGSFSTQEVALFESAREEMSALTHDDESLVWEAKYDAEQMRALLKKGHAIANDNGEPSYPIDDEADLANAIHAVGRGSGDHAAIRAYIVRRAKDLGKSDAIPDNWSASRTKESAPDVPATRPGDKKEARMGMKEIEESEFSRLTEQAGRVTTLEAALSKAQGELTEAKAALVPNKDLRDRITGLVTENAQLRAEKVAAPMIAEALEDAFIGEAAKGRIARELLEGITLKDGDDKQKVLDTDTLTEAINTKVRVAEAEAQELREAMGVGQVGRPRGLGSATTGGGLLVEQKLDEYTDTTASAIGKAFGLSEASAKTAATGR